MSDWKIKPLNEVVGLKRGFDLPESERRSGPYPVLGSAGISGWHDEGPVPGPGVTIGRSGSSIGVATYFGGPYWPLNTTLFVEDFRSNDPRFVYYLLHGIDFRGFDSGSAQPSLNRNFIAGIEVALPGRREQEAIAATLGALDDKITVSDRIASSVDTLLDAQFLDIMQSSFTRNKLSEIIDLRYGKALKASDRTPGSIPVYGSNGVSGSHITPLADGPGVVIGRKGANAGSVSWSQGPFWAIDTAFYVKPTTREIPLEFLYFLLRDANLQSYVGDSAIPGLNRDIALSCEVKFPDAALIDSFVSTARPLLELQDRVRKETQTLAALRDALLPKLMSGEIRVRDAEKVVEEAV